MILIDPMAEHISPTKNENTKEIKRNNNHHQKVVKLHFIRVKVSYVHSEDITRTISDMSNIKIWKKTIVRSVDF